MGNAHCCEAFAEFPVEVDAVVRLNFFGEAVAGRARADVSEEIKRSLRVGLFNGFSVGHSCEGVRKGNDVLVAFI
jgi:hypothetical protein